MSEGTLCRVEVYLFIYLVFVVLLLFFFNYYLSAHLFSPFIRVMGVHIEMRVSYLFINVA